jgi:hypothetical protein
MVPVFRHKINESVSLLRQVSDVDAVLTVRVRRLADDWLFNFITAQFEEEGGTASNYIATLNTIDPTLRFLVVDELPATTQDLLFQYTETVTANSVIVFEETSYERHLFGSESLSGGNSLCTVYGTLLSVAGTPLVGQKVEAFLNRSGFFTHKAGLVGTAANTITDDTGYFEMPLLRGLDVTITVPIIGFSVRGFVPNTTSVELTSNALLSAYPRT